MRFDNDYFLNTQDLRRHGFSRISLQTVSANLLAPRAEMIAKLTLPLLSVFMIYVGYEFTIVKGLIAKVEESRLLGIVPGGDVPLRTVYTGLDVPDQLFSTLTIFFWPVVDGTHLALRLHSIAFLGSLCSASVLITLESWRRGNAHTVTAL